MKSFSNEQLLEMADHFEIDPLFGVTLERRDYDPSVWALCYSGSCLNKNTGEWDFESSPSNRKDGFLAATRFASIQEAIEFYANWRKQRFFIFRKSKNDYRWHCYIASKEENQVRGFWENSLECEQGKNNRYGLWVFVGPGFEVLGRQEHPSSEGVVFKDTIAEIFA